MPGSAVTMDRRWPMRRLNSVDFPTFGRPMIAIRGREDDMRCSDGNSLPFWKIPHQKMVDLGCLPMVYSRSIETDRELKTNDRKRSGSEPRWLHRYLPIFYLVEIRTVARLEQRGGTGRVVKRPRSGVPKQSGRWARRLKDGNR